MDKRVLHIQSVLYHNERERIIRSIKSLVRAVDFALYEKAFDKVVLMYGDGSSERIFSDTDIIELNKEYGEFVEIKYDYFENNLGSAKGHNRLAESCTSEFILIINPDILLAPRTILNLLKPFQQSNSRIGIVEGKQLPIEHPKYYDPKTGETSWASTACALISADAFKEVNGFDSDTFFLYCDDVDFSWMVRNKGYKVIFQPTAVVFHDKTLSKEGEWKTSAAEDYYSAEAGLLLAYKWSRSDILNGILNYFESSSEGYYQKAAKEFQRRKEEGLLPEQLDKSNKIGEFTNNNYGKMRFSL